MGFLGLGMLRLSVHDEAELDALYRKAQSVAMAHLGACIEYEELMNETALEDFDKLPDNPAFGLWCGCDTCVVREVLHAAHPVFEEIFDLERRMGINA